MVWPILISVSVAPVSYFFCANAGLIVSAAPSAAATAVIANLVLNDMPVSFECALSRGTATSDFSQAARRIRRQDADEARDAARHHVHEQDQEHAVDRPRRGLRQLVRNIRHKLDEHRTKQCAGN